MFTYSDYVISLCYPGSEVQPHIVVPEHQTYLALTFKKDSPQQNRIRVPSFAAQYPDLDSDDYCKVKTLWMVVYIFRAIMPLIQHKDVIIELWKHIPVKKMKEYCFLFGNGVISECIIFLARAITQFLPEMQSIVGSNNDVTETKRTSC